MDLEIMQDLSQNEENIKFYNAKKVNKMICQTCNQVINDSNHLFIENNFYHSDHFICSVCHVNLLNENQTPYIRYKYLPIYSCNNQHNIITVFQ